MSEVGPVRRFFGGALLAVGFLIMALCGLCTAVGASVGFAYDRRNGGDLGPMALVIGGVSIAIGLGVFLGGKALRGKPLPRPTPPPAGFRGDDAP